MVGILIFNGDRPDIALDSGALYGGLHCGDCFQYYDRGWMSGWNTWMAGFWFMTGYTGKLSMVHRSKFRHTPPCKRPHSFAK